MMITVSFLLLMLTGGLSGFFGARVLFDLGVPLWLIFLLCMVFGVGLGLFWPYHWFF